MQREYVGLCMPSSSSVGGKLLKCLSFYIKNCTERERLLLKHFVMVFDMTLLVETFNMRVTICQSFDGLC